MRKGTPHPTASDSHSVDAPAPRRGRSQASRLLRSSRRGEERFTEALNDDVTLSDFTNLLRYSSASICLISFATPIPCDTNEWSFTDALYATPSKCVQANVSFARSRSKDSPEQMIGHDLNTLFPQAHGYREMFQSWHNHHLSRDGFEWQVSDQTDKPKMMHVACYGQIVGKGLTRLWIITREISKRIQAQRVATTSEHHLRSLLDQPGVLFMRAYPDGTLSFSTRETQECLHLNPNASQTIDSILGPRCHPSDRAELESLNFHRHLRSVTPARVTMRLITENRGLRSYSVQQVPSCVGEEIQYYDIIAMEPPVLVPKPASFLASGFAHDANNHLLIGSANIQVAERLLGDGHPALTPLRAALSAITQASTIYAQTRKLESGIIPQTATVDVGQEFREVIEQCEPITSGSVRLMTQVNPGEIFVRVDPTHFRQILTNLILNAREALQGHGAITLSATTKGEDPTQRCPIHGHEVVCVSVSDNGPGIELPLLQTIFSPFVSTKSSATPRGLGLAMVKTLTERNNGEVSATSAQGIGTTFTLCLPAASAKDSNRSTSDQPVIQAPRELSVLVADDDMQIRDIVAGALKARGHTATVFKDGHSLLATLKRSAPTIDAIIVDDGMPGSSGPALLEAIQEIRPGIPTILVSGDPSAADRVKQDHSRIAFLGKPFTFEKLYAVLENLASPVPQNSPLVPLRRRRTTASIE